MYRVSIVLSSGEKLEFVEKSLLRAVLLVESYHSRMEEYTVEMIENTEGCETICNGGKTNVHTEDHRQRCIS